VRGELGDIPSRLLAVAASIGYVANVFSVEGGHVSESLGHLWSLAQEEQFYVVWPSALILLLRLRATRGLVGPILLVAIAGVVLERFLFMSDSDFVRVYLGPDTHAAPILFGCLFAVWFAKGRLRRRSIACGVASVASVAIVVAAIAGSYDAFNGSGVAPRGIVYGTPVLTLFSLAAGILIVECAIGTSAVAQALSSAPLRFLGRISYSLYLWARSGARRACDAGGCWCECRRAPGHCRRSRGGAGVRFALRSRVAVPTPAAGRCYVSTHSGRAGLRSRPRRSPFRRLRRRLRDGGNLPKPTPGLEPATPSLRGTPRSEAECAIWLR